jgi:hypothetical protein
MQRKMHRDMYKMYTFYGTGHTPAVGPRLESSTGCTIAFDTLRGTWPYVSTRYWGD